MAEPLGNGPYFVPLAVNFSGLPCLVVGGGVIGTRKVETLLRGGAVVTVVAPEASESLQAAAAAGRIVWRREPYASARLTGCAFVVAATSDAELNAQIGREAEARGIWSCVASDAEHARVHFPAVYEDDEITVAFQSHGRDYRLSKQLRDELSAWLRQRRER